MEPQPGIATILHRSTLATIVGSRMFDRGERCFAEGRVAKVEGARGELRGVVRPSESSRKPYTVRVWVHEDGLAFECTCPIGSLREFCKHTVAIALAHLDQERTDAAHGLPILREALGAVPGPGLIDGLLVLARRDPALADSLKRLCLELLAQR